MDAEWPESSRPSGAQVILVKLGARDTVSGAKGAGRAGQAGARPTQSTPKFLVLLQTTASLAGAVGHPAMLFEVDHHVGETTGCLASGQSGCWHVVSTTRPDGRRIATGNDCSNPPCCPPQLRPRWPPAPPRSSRRLPVVLSAAPAAELPTSTRQPTTQTT